MQNRVELTLLWSGDSQELHSPKNTESSHSAAFVRRTCSQYMEAAKDEACLHGWMHYLINCPTCCYDCKINVNNKRLHFSRTSAYRNEGFPVREPLRGVNDDLKPCFCYHGVFMCCNTVCIRLFSLKRRRITSSHRGDPCNVQVWRLSNSEAK